MSASLLGWLATSFSFSLAWPQVWLSCLKGRVKGLSPTACWLAVAMSTAWLTYGVLERDAAQIATNTVVLTANTAILLNLLRRSPALRRPRVMASTAGAAVALLIVAAASAVDAAVTSASGAQVAACLGPVVSAASILSAVPQPASLLYDRTQDTSGISLLRWALSIMSSSLWLAYGAAMREPAVWTSAAFGVCCAIVVFTSVLRARRRHRDLLAVAGLLPHVPAGLTTTDVALAA